MHNKGEQVYNSLVCQPAKGDCAIFAEHNLRQKPFLIKTFMSLSAEQFWELIQQMTEHYYRSGRQWDAWASGDDSSATQAQLDVPNSVAIDARGALYIADKFIGRSLATPN